MVQGKALLWELQTIQRMLAQLLQEDPENQTKDEHLEVTIDFFRPPEETRAELDLQSKLLENKDIEDLFLAFDKGKIKKEEFIKKYRKLVGRKMAP